jgi:hypothetical protein
MGAVPAVQIAQKFEDFLETYRAALTVAGRAGKTSMTQPPVS